MKTRILTLNLHSWQEKDQDKKLSTIADVIIKENVDFIAFQESAQNRESPYSDQYRFIRNDNTSKIISDRIREQSGLNYSYIWDWSHFGFDIYEEGIALLSRYECTGHESRNISDSVSREDIFSRKVFGAQYIMNGTKINIFTVHISWKSSPLDSRSMTELKNLNQFVHHFENRFGGGHSFVCGDFNVNPVSGPLMSEGYFFMTENAKYSDSYLEIHPKANSLSHSADHSSMIHAAPMDGRIDYIFRSEKNPFRTEKAEFIFTRKKYGLVSDHYGYLAEFSLDTENNIG